MEKYRGSKTNILCRCKVCGHEWLVRPGNLLAGKGCPACSVKRSADNRRKTQSIFAAELAVKNTMVDVVGQYKNANTKILFRCKSCQYEWHAKPSHILNGHGCPVCGGSMRKDNNTFLAQLAEVNPMIEPLETYTSARSKLLCRCKHCEHKWPVTPDKLLQGAGCPNCDRRHKTSFPEQAIYFYLRTIYPEAVNRCLLPGTYKEIDIFLPSLNLGIEYDGYWHKNLEKSDAEKYVECKKAGIQLIRVREEGLPLVDNIADKAVIRYKPYNFATLDIVLKELFGIMGVRVPVDTLGDSASIRELFYTELAQNSLASRYPSIAAEWHPEKNGAITPKMVSYGTPDKYWWKCLVCQREWSAAVVDRTTGGKGCSKCAKSQASKSLKKKHEVFVEKLKEKNPNLEPIEEYQNTHTNILMRCKICSYEWPAAPANLLRGRNCPKCSREQSKGKISAAKREYHRKLKEAKE